MDIKRGMDHAAKIVLEDPLSESQAGSVLNVVSLNVCELVKDLSSQATMIETPDKIKSVRCPAAAHKCGSWTVPLLEAVSRSLPLQPMATSTSAR